MRLYTLPHFTSVNSFPLPLCQVIARIVRVYVDCQSLCIILGRLTFHRSADAKTRGVCVCTSKHSFDGLVPSRLHTRISRQSNVQTEPQAQSGSIVIDAFVSEGFRRPFKGPERCQRTHTSPWKESKVRVEHPAKQIHTVWML